MALSEWQVYQLRMRASYVKKKTPPPDSRLPAPHSQKLLSELLVTACVYF